jgi:hypothetical protein
MRKKRQSDLFGTLKEPDPRGWTELDRVRRRYSMLEKKVRAGDFNSQEMDELETLRVQIYARENEAREKWAKSFGK